MHIGQKEEEIGGQGAEVCAAHQPAFRLSRCDLHERAAILWREIEQQAGDGLLTAVLFAGEQHGANIGREPAKLAPKLGHGGARAKDCDG